MRKIDWEKVGVNLEKLRMDNISLRRYVCRVNHYDEAECSGECESCKYEMDNSISRRELAAAFYTTENVVCNWETARSTIDIESLLFYCDIAGVTLDDILVFQTEEEN